MRGGEKSNYEWIFAGHKLHLRACAPQARAERDSLDAGYRGDLALPKRSDSWRDSKGVGRTTSGQAADTSGNMAGDRIAGSFCRQNSADRCPGRGQVGPTGSQRKKRGENAVDDRRPASGDRATPQFDGRLAQRQRLCNHASASVEPMESIMTRSGLA